MSEAIQSQIKEQVSNTPIFLYMKGTPEAPACGFSHEVVHTLQQHNAQFGSFNVLENWDIREGIKTFANWPFIPQLYVNGKFVGGRDIIMDLQKKGELESLLSV